MTTTPQVDLVEARKLADALYGFTPLGANNRAADLMRALADEVEALREIESQLAEQHEVAANEVSRLQAELAAARQETNRVVALLDYANDSLKAVGPDGLPPLPERVAIIQKPATYIPSRGLTQGPYEFLHVFTADQMQAYARAAIAAAKPYME